MKKNENRREIHQIISDDLEELFTDLSAGREYFKSRTGRVPDTLYLTGGAAGIPGLSDMLRDSLELDVEIWNPLEDISNYHSIPLELKKSGTAFSVALGLLLRKIK